MTAQAATNEGQPTEKQVVMRVDFFRKLHPLVCDKLEATIERYTQLKAVRSVDAEGRAGLTLQEKAIVTLCAIAMGYAEGEECARQEKALDLGAPEAAETVAAETEDDVEDAEAFASEADLEAAEREAAARRVIVMPIRQEA
jgi:hypothetical protein